MYSCLAQLQPAWNSATRRAIFRDSSKLLCQVSLVLYVRDACSDGNDDEKALLANL